MHDESFGNGSAERLLGSLNSSNSSASQCGEDDKPSSRSAFLYDRGFAPHHKALPHCDAPGAAQFITYRLADSLPAEVLAKLAGEMQALPVEKQDAYRRQRIEEWADAGYGACLLRDPRIAALVVENWRHYDGERYQLLAWCVMPNHVHLLVWMAEGVALGKVVQGWKGYTGRRIQQLTGGKPGPIWQREYWDRYIRNERHFLQVVDYIHQNPVKAGLVTRAEDWAWSSLAEATLGVPEFAEQTLGAPGGGHERS